MMSQNVSMFIKKCTHLLIFCENKVKKNISYAIIKMFVANTSVYFYYKRVKEYLPKTLNIYTI